ncbi:unnamed protein product [Phytomonas sp. Hart1]|nr:unnamed protein product [Phytomonas sp. Hart1]|eukprot:CCW68219.1 unnamed protein product [Phytomonas sp. isolate Hart1]
MQSRVSLYSLGSTDDYLGRCASSWITQTRLNPKAHVGGNLHASTRFLIFEPDDNLVPVYYLTIRDITSYSYEKNHVHHLWSLCIDCSTVQEGNLCVRFRCTPAMTPLKRSVCQGKWLFRFTADYINTDFGDSLRAAITRNAQGIALRIRRREAVLQKQYSTITFLTKRVLPLREQRGVFVVTAEELLFKPLFPLTGATEVRLPSQYISHMFPRLIIFRNLGLDFYGDEVSSPLLSLQFHSETERDQSIKIILQFTRIPLFTVSFSNVFNQWQKGQMSNYEYLCLLNKLACRSLDDISQYPVFPWVISDYTSVYIDLKNSQTFRDLSKPIGALNETRLQTLERRMKELNEQEEPSYLYATHYSSAGAVAYFLLRSHPEYQLSLTHGKLDCTNRMFESIKAAWNGVNYNCSDFKELVMEFFNQNGVNMCAKAPFDLGMKDDKHAVAPTIILPPWATSAEDFIAKNIAALESDYVSSHLHLWIDLIFGVNQDGEGALQSKNVFHPFSYPQRDNSPGVGGCRGDTIPYEYAKEFGCSPVKLFCSKHPCKQSAQDFSSVFFTPWAQKLCRSDESTEHDTISMLLLAYQAEDAENHPMDGNSSRSLASCLDDFPPILLCDSALIQLSTQEMFRTAYHHITAIALSAPNRSIDNRSVGAHGVLTLICDDGCTAVLLDYVSRKCLRSFSDFCDIVEHVASSDYNIFIFCANSSLYIISLETYSLVDRIDNFSISPICLSSFSGAFGALADSQARVYEWTLTWQFNGQISSAQQVRLLSEAPSSVCVLRVNDSGTILCASTDGEVLVMRPGDKVTVTFQSNISSEQHILHLLMLSDSTSSLIVVVLNDEVHLYNFSGAMIKRLGLGSLETFSKAYPISTPEPLQSSLMLMSTQRMLFLWIESNQVQISQVKNDLTYLFNNLCSVNHLTIAFCTRGGEVTLSNIEMT